MKRLLYLSVLLLTIGTYAQDKAARKFAKTITVDDLEARLAVLASDSLEGRETATPGQKKAAKFIADHFSEIGLIPPVSTLEGDSYFQRFPLEKRQWHEVYLRKGEEIKKNFEDFVYYSNSETMGEEVINLVYAGEQLDSTLQTEGKFVVITIPSMRGDWQGMKNFYKEQGSAGFIILSENKEEIDLAMARLKQYLSRPRLSLKSEETMDPDDKILFMDSLTISWLFSAKYADLEFGQTSQAFLNADKHVFSLSSENVLGYIEGTEKPEELLVITSHYDHLGKRDSLIYNGADDDGSGTTTVMELAEAFSLAAQKRNRPARSILFMCVSGEEKGLLGSDYYTTNPVFPLTNTVTNLNIDMVGRVDEKHEGNPYYIYIIGSDKLSQDLHQLSERVNEETVNLEFDYTYNEEDDPNRFYYRSDHYNFAKNDIPVIFYFNGTHEDYHKPTDTIEKINFDKMQKIAELIFYTAWEIANREERIVLDKEK